MAPGCAEEQNQQHLYIYTYTKNVLVLCHFRLPQGNFDHPLLCCRNSCHQICRRRVWGVEPRRFNGMRRCDPKCLMIRNDTDLFLMSQHVHKLIIGKAYVSTGVPKYPPRWGICMSPFNGCRRRSGWTIFNVDIWLPPKIGHPKIQRFIHHVPCRKCMFGDCWDTHTIVYPTYWQTHIFKTRWYPHVCCYPLFLDLQGNSDLFLMVTINHTKCKVSHLVLPLKQSY